MTQLSISQITGNGNEKTLNPDDSYNKEQNQSETYNSLLLTGELETIFNQYTESHDDSLLKGLEPFDVFKFYHHAKVKSDDYTLYSLFYKEEEHQLFPYSNFEEYKADTSDVKSENDSKIITVNHFEVEYLSENEALINYKDPINQYPLSFRVVKNSEGVWKVSWMPIQ